MMKLKRLALVAVIGAVAVFMAIPYRTKDVYHVSA